MSESMLTMLVLGAELGALVLLICLVVLFFMFRRKRTDKKYVADFISTYKKDLPGRMEGIKGRLEGDFFIVGEDAEAVLGQLSNAETSLHKRILNLYLGNDRQCLSKIRDDVVSLSDKWVDVIDNSLANAAEAFSKTEAVAQMKADNTKLKEENAHIRKELAEAMQSMEEMLKEYSLLYADREDKNENMERLSGEYEELKKKTDPEN